jgi:hypothetical protein
VNHGIVGVARVKGDFLARVTAVGRRDLKALSALRTCNEDDFAARETVKALEEVKTT